MRLLAAIAWLRARLLVNGVRRTEGLLSAVGGIVLVVSAAVGAVVLAGGCAKLVATMAEREQGSEQLPWVYRIVLHGCFAIGVVVPTVMQGGSHGFDVTRLRRFPVRRTSLFGLVLATAAAAPEHLFYYPTLVALGVAGVSVWGQSELPTALLLVAFAATLVVWSHAVGLVVQRALRGRRLRESVGLVFLVVLMLVGFGPLVLQDVLDDPAAGAGLRDLLVSGAGSAVLGALPAELVATALADLARGRGAPGGALAGLGLWIVAGLALGRLAFGWVQDGSPKTGSVARRRAAAAGAAPAWLDRLAGALLPDEAWAVAVKDWRYLVRSVVGRFMLVMLPLVAAILAFALGRTGASSMLGVSSTVLGFYGLIAYVPMSLNVIVNNSFAWEGAGVQSYFLAPARLERTLLGKNLALGAYATLLALLAAIGWCAAAGPPPVYALVAGALLHVAAMTTFMALGNLVSLSFPSPRRVAAMNNALPAGAMFVSLAALACVVAQTAVGVLVPTLLGPRSWSVVCAAAVLAVAVAAYAALLPLAARWMERRREGLVASLRAGA